MYKKIIKAATGVLLSLSLAVVGFGMTADAAATTQPSSINGTSVRGTVKIDEDSMSAIATTTFSRNADITAKATVYYWAGKFTYCASKSASAGAGGATAVAKKKTGGADIIGGKGEHKVECSDGKWGPKYTTTGETPSNAIPE